MNDEARELRSIKIKPSIFRSPYHAAIKEGKPVGQWVEEESIDEKIERERKIKGGFYGSYRGNSYSKGYSWFQV